VDEIMTMLRSGLDLKAMAHITSDGLLNLLRIGKGYGYRIDYVPEPQPIYKLIKKRGHISIAEMYKVYNMGIGMCVVVPKEQADSALQIAGKFGKEAFVMGKATKDPERILDIRKPLRLIGNPNEGRFLEV
jgi:phosphoribosylformylglycinamidine cyclo-ligase